MSDFQWTEKASTVALALAQGKTRAEAAQEADITDRTVYRWLQDPTFSEEVDRLSVMVAVASRAERLRIVNRIVRQMVKDDRTIRTDKDLLDWLKFAQSETDGAKLDLTKVAAALDAHDASVAD